MKNPIKIMYVLAFFSLFSTGAFAQNYGSNYSYEYDDDVYLDDRYDNDDYYNNRRDRGYDRDRRDGRRYHDNGRRRHYDNGRRNNGRYCADTRRRTRVDHYRRQRARKAAILDRAYSFAYADGWLSRRERRELRELEDRLGIWRLDRRGRRVCR